MADSVRDYACLEDVVPLVTILDLAEGSKFMLEDGVEVSTATVHNFVTRYLTGLLVVVKTSVLCLFPFIYFNEL